MNDTSSLLKDKEELVKESSRFPIEFDVASLGSVFDRITIHPEEKKAKIESSLNELVKDVGVLDSFAPDISKSIDRQIQRLLYDLRKSPDNIYLINNLGRTYLSIGKLNEAEEYFKRALEIDSNFRLAMVNLAKSYMIQDKATEALSIYLKYIKKYPKDEKSLVDLAHVYLRLEKLDEARETIDKSLSLKPNNPNAYHTLGILCLMKGEIDRGISAFRKATSLDAHFAPSYTALGVCYAIKGSYIKAIKYLKVAYAIEPQAGYAAKNLAQAYQNKGDFEAAAALMREYLRRYPRDWEAQNNLAYSFFKLGDYRHSLESLQSLLNSPLRESMSGNRYAATLNNIGVVYLHMRLTPNAESMFYKSIEVSEQPNPITYFNLTKLLTELGRREEAKKLIDEYVTIAPDDQTPLILLAQNYMNEGQYDKSKEILEGILNKNPDSSDASVLLTLLDSEVSDEYDHALETIKRVYAKNKSDKTILNDLAYCYLRKGLVNEASDVLASVNWEKATFPLYATKGLLQISKGKVKEGISLYNTAVSRAPSNELKNMVRQKRNIEVARHAYRKGDRDEALRQLHNALSIKTKTKLYLDQASRLLRQIEKLPQQSRFPFRESGTKGDQ